MLQKSEVVTHLTASQITDINKETNKEGLDFNSMLISRPVQKTGYIVITSDGGLVGGYNSSILKQMMTMLADDHKSPDEYVMIAIGGTGADFSKREASILLMNCGIFRISLALKKYVKS